MAAVCTPPSTSTFSFKAPFPATSSALKQRRVSLALPSAPRLVPAWSFRDDTGLDSHTVASTSELVPEKRGKMRKIANDDSEREMSEPVATEKKQRKKWNAEETQMLVDGCNVVSTTIPITVISHTHPVFSSGVWATGRRY